MSADAAITVFACGPRQDHVCDDAGPFLYGGDSVPTVTDQKLAGRGYSWGSTSCSVCGDTSMNRAMWQDDSWE